MLLIPKWRTGRHHVTLFFFDIRDIMPHCVSLLFVTHPVFALPNNMGAFVISSTIFFPVFVAHGHLGGAEVSAEAHTRRKQGRRQVEVQMNDQ